MCGIVGYVGSRQATPVLINGLRKLEYRGYDSAGVAVLSEDSDEILVKKSKGALKFLVEKITGEVVKKSQSETEEETEILDIVNKAGGKKWLDGLKDMSSTFTANNRKFVAHGDDNSAPQGETRAQKMLREQRERQEAKRKARK